MNPAVSFILVGFILVGFILVQVSFILVGLNPYHCGFASVELCFLFII